MFKFYNNVNSISRNHTIIIINYSQIPSHGLGRCNIILTRTFIASVLTCFKISSTHWCAMEAGEIINVAPEGIGSWKIPEKEVETKQAVCIIAFTKSVHSRSSFQHWPTNCMVTLQYILRWKFIYRDINVTDFILKLQNNTLL